MTVVKISKNITYKEEIFSYAATLRGMRDEPK
jgi:hypothetical protein